jgi:hypothetical protein
MSLFKYAVVLLAWAALVVVLCESGHLHAGAAIGLALGAIIVGIPIAYASRETEAQRRLLNEVLAAHPEQVTLWVEYHSYFDSWAGYHVENQARLYAKLNGTPGDRLARAWAGVVKLTKAERVELGYGTLLIHDLVAQLTKAGFAVHDPHTSLGLGLRA